MGKIDWTSIADALHVVRKMAKGSGPPHRDDPHPETAHDRKLIYWNTLETIDRVAIVIAATIKGREPRFDEQRFLSLVGVKR